MRLLLDTHIWLWSIREPHRVGKRVARELSNPQNERWLSPISTWEALILNAKGRIRLPANLESWLARSTAPFREAPFTHEIALASQIISLPHRDPADRFLVATAQVLQLTLVTADRQLLGLGEISTLANH